MTTAKRRFLVCVTHDLETRQHRLSISGSSCRKSTIESSISCGRRGPGLDIAVSVKRLKLPMMTSAISDRVAHFSLSRSSTLRSSAARFVGSAITVLSALALNGYMYLSSTDGATIRSGSIFLPTTRLVVGRNPGCGITSRWINPISQGIQVVAQIQMLLLTPSKSAVGFKPRGNRST